MRISKNKSLLLAASLVLSACSSTTKYDNSAGRATVYSDVKTGNTQIQGVGIESQDIVKMTDQMMRSMISNPTLAGRQSAPRIIIDSEYFTNESTSRINKNILTDRLRVQLNRAANGRMVFVARNYANMVESERRLKREGVVDAGTVRSTQATAGADYRLVGKILSSDKMNVNTQMKSRYHYIYFEMVDLELGTYVWSGDYEFEKSGQDDVVYR